MNDTEQFLDIETKQHLWDVAIDGIHLWPALREDVKWTLNRREANHQERQTAAAWRVLHPKLWGKHAKTLKFLGTPASLADFDTMVMIWSNDHIYQPIYEHLATPLILESSWFGQSDSHNWGRYPTILHDTLKIGQAIHAKVKKIPTKQLQQIEDFASQITQVYAMPENRGRYIKLAADHVHRYHFLKPIVHKKISTQLKTKTAFVSIASYMARKAAWTQLLHEAGCTVIEAQHGFIARDTIPYQHSHTVLTDTSHPARLYMPDELWMFGDYWTKIAHVPSIKHVIGFPRLTNRIESIDDSMMVSNERQILFISQWTVTKQLMDLAYAVAKALPDYRLIYKLHPIETTFPANTYESLRECSNVEIASSGDLYQWIAESSIIVGSYSTALVEALAFPHKRIFNIKNEFLEDGIVTTFNTADELISYIRDVQSGFASHDPTYYWQNAPQSRIIQALKNLHLM